MVGSVKIEVRENGLVVVGVVEVGLVEVGLVEVGSVKVELEW